MKRYASQIRLQKFAVDEARRRLADLQQLEERLTNDRTRLETELAEEQNVAGRSFDNSLTYGVYAVELLKRRDKLDQSIADIAKECLEARDAVNEAFGELKKFELASEAVTQRALRQANQREQQQLDETALTMFRREQDAL